MSKKQYIRRLCQIITIQQVIWDAFRALNSRKKMKKLNQVKNLIEIDLEIRSRKFGITQTTTQSKNL